MSRIIIKNANQVLTLKGHSTKPKIKNEMSDLGILENGWIACEDEKIAHIGSQFEAESFIAEVWGQNSSYEVIDATDKLVMPGLIDPHTHLVFAGSREHELEMRLNGAKYLDILAAGGGILSTTKQTREASEDELISQARKRLDKFLAYGVTTIEAKSGYGLDLESELKQLRVAKNLNLEHSIDIVSTFMGAHAIPMEHKKNIDFYVDLVINDMLPKVKAENLAEFCDVFCEQGVFSVEQSRKILEAAKKIGFTAKIHADEIVPIGGAELAAEVGAISADHLLQASDKGIEMMANAGTIAVLLPGTAFFLMADYARARDMIEAGVAVALSTDRNPGSSPTESLQMIMNLACLNMKMNPAEVISATTINAAHAINRADTIGSIEVGKQADILVMDAPNYVYLQYNYGVNLVKNVIKKGKLVI